MQRLFLVRHGETAHNQLQILRGQASQQEGLSKHGQLQAQACAAALGALGLLDPKVYASTYLRAQQTAEFIAGALGVHVTVLGGMQEMDTGSWNGRSYSALAVPAAEIRHQDGHFGFAGGESLPGVTQRFRAALDEILSRGGTPIAVSHGMALQVIVAELLGVPFDEAYNDQRFAHHNTAVTQLLWDGKKWQAEQIAAAGHLQTLG